MRKNFYDNPIGTTLVVLLLFVVLDYKQILADLLEISSYDLSFEIPVYVGRNLIWADVFTSEIILYLKDDDDVHQEVELFCFRHQIVDVNCSQIHANVAKAFTFNGASSRPLIFEESFHIGQENPVLFQVTDDDVYQDLNKAVSTFCMEYGLSTRSCSSVFAHTKSKINVNLPTVNSFDVFDTILGRSITDTQTSDIFDIIEKNFPFSNFAELRRHAQMVAASKHTDILMTFEQIYDEFQQLVTSIDVPTRLRLQRYEIDCLMNNTYLIQRNYQLVRDGDILISNSYFNSSVLSRILKHVGFTKVVNMHVFARDKLNKGMKWSQLTKLYHVHSHTGRITLYDMRMAKQYNITLHHSKPLPSLDRLVSHHLLQHRCLGVNEGNESVNVNVNDKRHSLVITLLKSDRSSFKWGNASFWLQSTSSLDTVYDSSTATSTAGTHHTSSQSQCASCNNSSSSSLVCMGEFGGFGHMWTRHFCLTSGNYMLSLSENFNHFKIGAHVCDQLVKPGQSFHFSISGDECVRGAMVGDAIGLSYDDSSSRMDTLYSPSSDSEYVIDDLFFHDDGDNDCVASVAGRSSTSSQGQQTAAAVFPLASLQQSQHLTNTTRATSATSTPLKIRIHTLKFTYRSGAIVVLHYLAKLLHELGHDVKMFCTADLVVANANPIYFDANENPIFSIYTNQTNESDAIAIYSEGLHSNPIGAKRVVRWITAALGITTPFSILQTWHDDDLVYHYWLGGQLRSAGYGVLKMLTTPYINPIFIPPPALPESEKYSIEHRPLIVYTYHKASHFHLNGVEKWHPSWAINVYNSSNEEYVSYFQRSRVFFCYDPQSFMSQIAALCGCAVVIYPVQGLSEAEYWASTPFGVYLSERKKASSVYGVSYGLEGLSEARKTVHLVRQETEDMAAFYKQSVHRFSNDLYRLLMTATDSSDPAQQPINTVRNTYRKSKLAKAT